MQRGDHHRLALVHSDGGGLQHQHVLVFVHDESAKKIALGIDDAEGGCRRQVPASHGERHADAFLKKRLVHRYPARRQHPDVDFGFGVVEADAEKTLAMVLDLHQFTVAGGPGQAQDRAVINPWMAGHDAVGFAGFQQHRRQ